VWFAVLLACAVMATLLLWQSGVRDQWLAAGAAHRAGMLAMLVTSGCAVYVLVLFVSGLRKHDLEKGAV
jgi:putative peptidoglycan lipid II flippase